MKRKCYTTAKRFLAITCTTIFAVGGILTTHAEENLTGRLYEVISTNENALPENISIQPKIKITFDHTSGTKSHDNFVYTRYCWGRTQAQQGTIKLSSYTRARYEDFLGFVTADSGRVWSKVEGGPSYAESGDVSADIGSIWTAHTYYGTSD